MRSWISVGAVALACSLSAARADATLFVQPAKSNASSSLGSLLGGLFGNVTKPIVTIPVVTVPKVTLPVVTIPAITVPVVTIPTVPVPSNPAPVLAGTIGQVIEGLIEDKLALIDKIGDLFDHDTNNGGWSSGGHHPGDGCNPGHGTTPADPDPQPNPGGGGSNPVDPDPNPGSPTLPPIDGGTGPIVTIPDDGLPDQTGPVPEPAAWMTMIAGFGFIGGALRTRRTRSLARSAG